MTHMIILAAGNPLKGHALPHIPSKIWFFAAVAVVVFLTMKQSTAAWWHLVEGALIGVLFVAFFPTVGTFAEKNITATVVTAGHKPASAMFADIAIAVLVVLAITMVVRERKGGG